ncbi:hypothetical protein MMC10_002246 [Thelotrema lepadinum]|nr:hypothetical protein [Thelotrema lepadinum]
MASITLSTLLTLFLLLSTLMSLVVKGAPTDPSVLNLTAISAENGQSIFECWQLKAPFLDSNQAGTDGAVFAQLGNASNASFAILPPKFSAGLHNAPFVQYVVFTSGRAHISLPNSTEKAIVHGGKRGLLIAADTADISEHGHNTTYPSDENTISINIPTKNGKIPKHTCLYRGPCKDTEMLSL